MLSGSEWQKCGLKYVMHIPRKKVGEVTYDNFELIGKLGAHHSNTKSPQPAFHPLFQKIYMGARERYLRGRRNLLAVQASFGKIAPDQYLNFYELGTVCPVIVHPGRNPTTMDNFQKICPI